MSKILSISIPDKLNERLQAHKGSLNMSALCQEALDAAIRIEEAKNMEGDEMEKLVERLSAEKAEATKSAYDLGISDGITDAKNLALSEFEAIALLFEDRSEHEDSFYEALKESFSDDWDEWFEKIYNDWGKRSAAYCKGWVYGVMEIWSEVKDKI